jgi:hypothetical protein
MIPALREKLDKLLRLAERGAPGEAALCARQVSFVLADFLCARGFLLRSQVLLALVPESSPCAQKRSAATSFSSLRPAAAAPSPRRRAPNRHQGAPASRAPAQPFSVA